VVYKPNTVLCWESFFQCQRHPMLRSQLLTALMAGTPLSLEWLPTPMLLDVVLVCTAARNHCDAEIIDDYRGLLDKVNELWSQPNWSCKVFSSIHGSRANSILQGSAEFTCTEELYIPAMVDWYLTHEPPQYLAVEFETDAQEKAWRKKYKK